MGSGILGLSYAMANTGIIGFRYTDIVFSVQYKFNCVDHFCGIMLITTKNSFDAPLSYFKVKIVLPVRYLHTLRINRAMEKSPFNRHFYTMIEVKGLPCRSRNDRKLHETNLISQMLSVERP